MIIGMKKNTKSTHFEAISTHPLQKSSGLERKVRERKWRNQDEQENKVSNFGRF